MRRGLLGLLAGLFVARTLLSGTDPGRLLPDTSTGPLYLVLLWLLAAVGWAAWRIWTGKADWQRGFLEPGLLAFTAIVFLSVLGGAQLRQAGWLFAWEWLAICLAFIIVRQLPCSERELRSLLAVVLATGVSLAAQALVQALLPASVVPVDSTVAAIYGLPATLPLHPPVFGAPGTFAAYLVLLAPALACGWFLVGQTTSPTWRRVLTGSCLVIVCLALGLTGFWPAFVALLTAVALVLWAARGHLPRATVQYGILAALGLSAIFVGFAAGRGDLTTWWQGWSENLRITTLVLTGRADYGVSPVSFERYYAAFLPSPAADRPTAPANFVLEVLAGCGYWALGMLLVVLAAYFVRVWPELRKPWAAPEDEPAARSASPATSGLAWEFYLGGLAGLMLAIICQLGEEATRRELGLKALPLVLRSLAWFAVFPFLDSIPWTPRWRTVALIAGTTAGLLCLSVSGGFFNPALAQTFWVLAALALRGATHEPAVRLAGGRLISIVPVAVLALLWWTYLLVFLYPLVRASSLLAEARRAYPEWRTVEEPQWRQALARRNPLPLQHEAARRASDFLQGRILKPLDDAVQVNGGSLGPRAELAYWYGRAYEVFALMRIPADEPLTVREVRQVQTEKRNLSLHHLGYGIEQVDPQGQFPIGREMYQVGWRLRFLFADQPGMSPEDRQDQYRMAINGHLRPLLQSEPMQPQLHVVLADALHRFDPKDDTEWRKEVDTALDLDRRAGAGTLRLTPRQRQQIGQWLQPQNDWGWLP